jgi:hypothetical protein
MNFVPSGTFESINLGFGTVFGLPPVQSGISPHSNEMEKPDAIMGVKNKIRTKTNKTHFFPISILLSYKMAQVSLKSKQHITYAKNSDIFSSWCISWLEGKICQS